MALAETVHEGGGGGSSARQDAQAGEAPDVGREGSRAGGVGAAPCAGRGDALDGARLGEDGRPQPGDGAQDSRPPQNQAAPGVVLQGLDRSGVHEEDLRRRGAVNGSAGSGGGAVDRREDADSGAGTDAEGPADEGGAARDDDARLQAERNHDPVRRAEHLGRDGDRPPRQAPPGVHRVP